MAGKRSEQTNSHGSGGGGGSGWVKRILVGFWLGLVGYGGFKRILVGSAGVVCGGYLEVLAGSGEFDEGHENDAANEIDEGHENDEDEEAGEKDHGVDTEQGWMTFF